MINIRDYMKEREKNENEDDHSFQKKLWFHRGRKLTMAVMVCLAVVGIIVGYQYYRKHLVYTAYDVLAVSELTELVNGEYKAYGDYILRYSMDGISCMDKNGGLVWGQAYEMKNPIVDVCGNYVVVASQKGNEVYIFNKSGYQGEVKTQYPITTVRVAGQGVVAVLLEDSGNNYIKMYDIYGTELVTSKSSLEGDGYPFAYSLSEDGKKLAMSSLNIEGNSIKNVVEFYNFSDVGQNYVEQLVGTYQEEFQDSLVPKIEFVNNNTVCAFADNQMVMFRMKEIPEIVVTVPLEEKVHAVFYNEAYVGMIMEHEQEGAMYQLQVYSTADGSLVPGISGLGLSEEYKEAFFTEENVVLYNEYFCKILNLEGVEKFNYTFEKNIVLFKHIADVRYTLITPSSISEIRLK